MILTKFNSLDEADLYRQACLTACSAIAMVFGLTKATTEEICFKILADAGEEPTRKREVDFERWKRRIVRRLTTDDKAFGELYGYFEGACVTISYAWKDLRGKV